MFESILPRASSYAGDIDGLILLILVLVGFWFVLAEVIFFYFIFKFRHREGDTRRALYVSGELKQEKKWISIPHALVLVCDLFIVVGAIRVWVNIKQTLPTADQTVRVVGQQWAWTFVHPGLDGKIDTEDDIRTIDELHIQSGLTYHYKLVSRDVLHSFSVPVFRLKHDAIPGREITGWFKPTRTGTFDIQCAEICGIGHGIMGARLFIETPEEHRTWMRKQPRNPAPTGTASTASR